MEPDKPHRDASVRVSKVFFYKKEEEEEAKKNERKLGLSDSQKRKSSRVCFRVSSGRSKEEEEEEAAAAAAMPKNKGKGGKNRKRGKNEADDEKRELVFKEDGQEYAQVLRMLGNGRCEAMCIDGTKRLCHIRGKMHKKVWIAAGDIILVGLRDYQDDKADVILKYMPDEARLLKAYGELPDTMRLNEGIAAGLDEEDDNAGDDYIEFEDEDIDKI